MKNRVKTSRGIAILAIGFVLALAAIGLFLKQFDLISESILPPVRPAQAALDGAGSGLVGWWKFDEGSGTTATDSSGSGSNGTLTNGPTWDTSGKIEGAIFFDGIDDNISLSNASGLNINISTISFWINPASSFSGTVYRLSNSTSNSTYRSKYEIRVASSAITFITGDGTTADTDVFSAIIPSGAWSHILCSLDAGNVKQCYLNGSLISSATNNADISLNSSMVALIGSNRNLAGNNFYEGSLDEFRIYNRALSASEIAELYAYTGGTPPPPPADTTAPSVPSGLSATVVSSSQINLSWSASTDDTAVTGYRIYRNGSEITTTGATSYSNTGLTASTLYSYAVTAYDAAGNQSAQSTSASATTQAAAPTTYTLTVSKSGTGAGTVSGGSISCGSTCSQSSITSGTVITLSVAPDANSAFGGWSGGGCSGTGNCVTTISSNTNITATFTLSGGQQPGVCSLVSQFGITWYFDKEYACGTFANGEYWVKGPVTITRITPDFDGINNGWEVNPKVQLAQGFQSNGAHYNASLMPALPYTAATNQSIVKVVGGTTTNSISKVKTAAVLTVLMETPPDNGASVFRPPYIGDAKPLYKVSDLRTDLLPSYAPVGTPPTLATVVGNFSKGLRMDHDASVPRHFRPWDAMGDYQPQNTKTINETILRLMLNDSIQDKMPVLIQATQHALDRAYAVLNGYRRIDDGHNPNHRILAGWAAAMLDIQSVKDMLMNESTIMHEDYYVLKPGTVAIWGDPTGDFSYIENSYWNYIMTGSGSKSTKDPYGYIDGGKLGPSGASYQNIVVQSQKGEVLITHLMPALSVSWRPSHWPIFSEYVDRWVNYGVWALPDPCAPYDGNQANYKITFGPDPNNPGKCILGSGRFPQYDGAGKDGGQYKSAFVASMWDAYRLTAGGTPPPTPISGSCSATLNTCAAGAFSDLADTAANYLWNCTGSNGGTTASCSLPIPLLPDITLPTISITSPISGATITGSISLSASASDPIVAGQAASGIVSVQFKLDNVNIGQELTTAPYSGAWNTVGVANGTHTLTAIARDQAGNRATSTLIAITVSNTAETPPAPATPAAPAAPAPGGSPAGGTASPGSGSPSTAPATPSTSAAPSPQGTFTPTVEQPKATSPSPLLRKEGNTTPLSGGQDAQLRQILLDAAAVWSGNVQTVLANAKAARNPALEKTAAGRYLNGLTNGQTGLLSADASRLNYFLAYGTVSSRVLGGGERAGALNSYKSAFSKLPKTEADWQDVLKIANGRWPSQRSNPAEAKAKLSFKQIYGREAKMANANDSNAITIMAYGLRPSKRNLKSEKAAILSFRYFIKRAPSTAVDWDIVRAIAYSGAKR